MVGRKGGVMVIKEATVEMMVKGIPFKKVPVTIMIIILHRMKITKIMSKSKDKRVRNEDIMVVALALETAMKCAATSTEY